ncbi:MAG: hypothetical protein ACI9YL_002174 [Luteibaculaceae bacterium]|jgi:hypothetical protein
MKNQLILSLGLLFLIGCSGTGNKNVNSAAEEPTESIVVLEEKVQEPKAEDAYVAPEGSYTLKAKFIDFELGDASHYGFEDETGKMWNFAGCDSKNFEFALELDDAEGTTFNQGWGSNAELQGKWFMLTIVEVEQPEYIDGPMVMAKVIDEALLVEE